MAVRNECRAALYYIAKFNHPASLPKLNWQCYPSLGYFTKYFTHKESQYKTSALYSPLRNYLSVASGKTPDITRCPQHKLFLTIFTWKHQVRYSPSLRFPFHVFCGQTDLAEKYRRAMASFMIRETKSGPLLRTFLNSLRREQLLSHGKVHVYRQVAPSCFSICLVWKTTLDIVSAVYRKYIQEFLLYNFHTESYTLKIHTFAWDFTFLTSCQESLHI